MDVRGVEFQRDPSGRVNLIIRERNGRKVSAYSASDGTLALAGQYWPRYSAPIREASISSRR